MAAEYIAANYPGQTGFSPRNLRRMRDLFRMYEGHPEMLEQAVKVGWIQNLAIMEADLDMDARYWYLLAVQRFGWSKAELTKQIAAGTHLEATAEKKAQDGEKNKISKIVLNRIWLFRKMIIKNLDTFKKSSYNRSWKINFNLQTGIMGDAYG